MTVKAPKIQVSPKRDMTPAIPQKVFSKLFRFEALLAFFNFLLLCLMTKMTMDTKIPVLKIITANIGPRKASNSTKTSLMKQLGRVGMSDSKIKPH